MQHSLSVGSDPTQRVSGNASSNQSPRERARAIGKRIVRLLAQLALIVVVYAIGCALASILPIALPGNILGMVLLLVLLGTGLLKTHHVGNACDCLIDNMSLFFIPASVAIMGSVALLEGNVLKFALVCIVTTVLVFLATSYTVVLVSRLMVRRKNSSDARETNKQTPVNEEA